jgi:transcriptional regulator with XRE-family HTH domain
MEPIIEGRIIAYEKLVKIIKSKQERKEVADQMGITPGAITLWLRGIYRFPIKRIHQMCDVLELDDSFRNELVETAVSAPVDDWFYHRNALETVKKRIVKKGLNRGEVAKMMGVKKKDLSLLLNARSPFTEEKISQISRILGLEKKLEDRLSYRPESIPGVKETCHLTYSKLFGQNYKEFVILPRYDFLCDSKEIREELIDISKRGTFYYFFGSSNSGIKYLPSIFSGNLDGLNEDHLFFCEGPEWFDFLPYRISVNSRSTIEGFDYLMDGNIPISTRSDSNILRANGIYDYLNLGLRELQHSGSSDLRDLLTD